MVRSTARYIGVWQDLVNLFFIQLLINESHLYHWPINFPVYGALLPEKNNSILKFSIPISKSTIIEIKKDELGKIASKKIITKLYKKRMLSENII